MTVEVRPRVAATAAYRPDIDGLRAIAIALVVAFHFGVPGFTGGYLGVDLFFVISGFLIGAIFERHPIVSWSGVLAFYARRVKRLMPAFVFVAVVTVSIATVLLLPDDYEAFLRSIRDSLGFTANRYFGRETTGYFAANATELPWLHTWSLSVEWQFYLAFPLVLSLLGFLPTRRLRTIGLLVLVVVGVVWSIAFVETRPGEAYFSASARFFEFLLGALGAALDAARPSARSNRVLSICGVVALTGLALIFDGTTPFPGTSGLGVCLVGLVLVAIGPDGSVLSHPALAWIGRRSYSIYLWHWPVVAFCNYVQHRMSAMETIAAVGLVVLLAAATYRMVEKPGMALTWGPTRTLATWWLAPLACAALLFLVVHLFEGFPQRFGPGAVYALANTRSFKSHRYDRCHDDHEVDLEKCAFGDLASPVQALLIGDSHARHFRPFVDDLALDARVKVYGLTDSECLALEATGIVPDRPPRPACMAAIARDYALIRDHRYRYVIVAERWIGYLPGRLRLASLDASIAAIVASGAVPVILKSAAEDGTNTKDCFYRRFKMRSERVEDCSIREANEYAEISKRQVRELIDRVQTTYPTMVVIDPQAVQCARGSCETSIDATPIYTDTHHLSEFGSTMLARAYRERFGNPLSDRSTVSPPRAPTTP